MPDIHKLIRQCGGIPMGRPMNLETWSLTQDGLLKLERRIREDEREKAAKVCETLPVHDEFIEVAYNTAVKHCAAAIRRGGDHG